MGVILQTITLIVGFVLLIRGADWLVNGASSTALNFKIPKTLIGLTIIAFGTGAPELAISISSLMSGNTDMLLGNVVGSNILNVLLLTGIGALVRPITVKSTSIRKELILLVVLTLTLVVASLKNLVTSTSVNSITRADALIFVLMFGIFLFFVAQSTRRNRKEKHHHIKKPQYTLGKSLILVVVGLAGIIAGSQFVVNSASAIAATIGISDRIIALTIVAFGTSLPELMTTITASKRGEHELLVGNIIGSNIFNICVVLGLPVLIFGTIVPESLEMIDLVAMVVAVFALYFMTLKDHKITRIEGLLMLAIFAIYYSYVLHGALI